jgi:hypothetical protein
LFCTSPTLSLSQEHEKIIAKLLVILKDRKCLKADVTQPHRLTAHPKHIDPDFLQTVIRNRAGMIQDYLTHAWKRFSRTHKVFSSIIVWLDSRSDLRFCDYFTANIQTRVYHHALLDQFAFAPLSEPRMSSVGSVTTRWTIR